MSKKDIILDDSTDTEIVFSPICIGCIHYLRSDLLDNGTHFNVCQAFQEGIPAEIWEGRNDHTKPYKGDNGIQYKSLNS